MAIHREYRLEEPLERARRRIVRELEVRTSSRPGPPAGRVGARHATLRLGGDLSGFRSLPRMEIRMDPVADGTLVRVCIRWSHWITGVAAALVLACAAIPVGGLLTGRWEALVLLIPAGGFLARLGLESRGPASDLALLADRLFSP